MGINGKKVVDATRPLIIKVSKTDVVKGANKDPGACAAARAAKRLPKCLAARVHLGRVYVERPDKWVRYKTGDALRGEIIAFDRGGKFEPGDYKIMPPSPSDRPGSPAYKRSREQRARDLAATEGRPNKFKKARKLHVVRGVRSHGANR